MQPIRGTCNCSVQICRRMYRQNDVNTKTILDFHHMPPTSSSIQTLDTVNIDLTDTSGLDHKHITAHRTQLATPHSLQAKTSGDISREQQDRTKRFKQKVLFEFFK